MFCEATETLVQWKRKSLGNRLAWCSLNKTQSSSLKHHHHHLGTVVVAFRFTSAMPMDWMVYSSVLTLATLVVVLARFNSWDHFFFTSFKSLQIFSLGVGVSIRHGHQKGEDLYDCSKNGCFLSFQWEKNNFHHFWPPSTKLKKNLLVALSFGKNPSIAHGIKVGF